MREHDKNQWYESLPLKGAQEISLYSSRRLEYKETRRLQQRCGQLRIDLRGKEESEGGVRGGREELLFQKNEIVGCEVHVLQHNPAATANGDV